jgi:hypothetical protein
VPVEGRGEGGREGEREKERERQTERDGVGGEKVRKSIFKPIPYTPRPVNRTKQIHEFTNLGLGTERAGLGVSCFETF